MDHLTCVYTNDKKELNELLECLLKEECDVSSRGRKRLFQDVNSPEV